VADKTSHISAFVPLKLREALEQSAHAKRPLPFGGGSLRSPRLHRQRSRPGGRSPTARPGAARAGGVVSYTSTTDYWTERMYGREGFEAIVQARSRSRPLSLEDELKIRADRVAELRRPVTHCMRWVCWLCDLR
jgi:hypothetical protein